MSDVICNIEGCDDRSIARGLCWRHYMRARRYGSALFHVRRYGEPPLCRYCGTKDPDAFYSRYKSVCKRCKKLRAINQRREAEGDITADQFSKTKG